MDLHQLSLLYSNIIDIILDTTKVGILVGLIVKDTFEDVMKASVMKMLCDGSALLPLTQN